MSALYLDVTYTCVLFLSNFGNKLLLLLLITFSRRESGAHALPVSTARVHLGGSTPCAAWPVRGACVRASEPGMGSPARCDLRGGGVVTGQLEGWLVAVWVRGSLFVVSVGGARWRTTERQSARSCAISYQLPSSRFASRRSLLTERPNVIKGAPRGRGLVTQLESS